jgi:hypothetical protein
MNQERREHHYRQQLQKFRLPVLEGRGQEFPDVAIAAEHGGCLLVLDLPGRELAPAGPCLLHPTDEETGNQDEAQIVSRAIAVATFRSCALILAGTARSDLFEHRVREFQGANHRAGAHLAPASLLAWVRIPRWPASRLLP